MHINQIKSDCIGQTDNFFSHGYNRHIRDIVKLWRLLYDGDAVDDADDDVRLLENIWRRVVDFSFVSQ